MRKVNIGTLFETQQSIDDFWKMRGGQKRKVSYLSNLSVISFPLDDRIEGFSFLFGAGTFDSRTPVQDQEYPKANIYGILDVFSNKSEKYFLKLGKLDMEDFNSISARRFSYIFGSPPAKDKDITGVLVKLNKFPKTYTKRVWERYGIRYDLVERDLDELGAPKAARLLFDEAMLAKEQGLFADVKAYEMTSEEYKIPTRDPVIAGIDHFGNKFPLIYWAGDKHPVKED